MRSFKGGKDSKGSRQFGALRIIFPQADLRIATWTCAGSDVRPEILVWWSYITRDCSACKNPKANHLLLSFC